MEPMSKETRRIQSRDRRDKTGVIKVFKIVNTCFERSQIADPDCV